MRVSCLSAGYAFSSRYLLGALGVQEVGNLMSKQTNKTIKLPKFVFGITAAAESVDLRLLAIARPVVRTRPSIESDT